MNETGKDDDICAVAVPLHIILDPDGNPWGPFNDATKAWEWAEAKWPGKSVTDVGIGGWDLIAMRWPD